MLYWLNFWVGGVAKNWLGTVSISPGCDPTPQLKSLRGPPSSRPVVKLNCMLPCTVQYWGTRTLRRGTPSHRPIASSLGKDLWPCGNCCVAEDICMRAVSVRYTLIGALAVTILLANQGDSASRGNRRENLTRIHRSENTPQTSGHWFSVPCM